MESAPCGERWANTLRITMPSGIIKGSPTSCCFLRFQDIVARSLCNVASDWVGSCVFTIERLRELAGKSRTMPVRLLSGCAYRNVDALLTMMIADELTGWPPLISPAWLADQAIKDRDSDHRRLNSRLKRQAPQINFLALRGQTGKHVLSLSPVLTRSGHSGTIPVALALATSSALYR